MARLGRPASPGFTSVEASTFRRIFRSQCSNVGASHGDIGRAIDEYGLADNADGVTVVQNALAPARKLTHRTARIIVAGLFLAESVRMTQPLERQQLALTTLGGAMYAYRAWGPDPAIPAFIPLDAIDALASRLSDGRPALRKLLSRRLHAEASTFARAWCEHVRRTPITRTTSQIIAFIELSEELVRNEYGLDSSERIFTLGPEFDTLNHERPDLTRDFLHELSRAHAIDARKK